MIYSYQVEEVQEKSAVIEELIATHLEEQNKPRGFHLAIVSRLYLFLGDSERFGL